MFSQNKDIIDSIYKQFSGKYNYIQYIGQGSFSKVFKAKDNEQKEVAIKVINMNEQSQYVIKTYLENEIRILEKACDCDNVVKLIDYKQSKDYIFIVLEYCQFDLDQVRIQFFNGQIPEDIAIIIFRQIANGLAQLHKNRIIHRDLKLENIAVVLNNVDLLKITQNDFRSATYKLIDFGLSKILNDTDQTNTFIGTPATMAPEILNDDQYSFEADIYSLGCCLFFMITGQYPYFEKKKSMLFKSIKSENAQFNLIKNEELQNIIIKMMKQNTQQRMTWVELYQTSFFRADLRIQLENLDFELDGNQKFYEKFNEQQQPDQENSVQVNNKSQILNSVKSLTRFNYCQQQKCQKYPQKFQFQNCINNWNLFIIINKAIHQIKNWQNYIELLFDQKNYDQLDQEYSSIKICEIKYDVADLVAFNKTLYNYLHQYLFSQSFNGENKNLLNQLKLQLELLKEDYELQKSLFQKFFQEQDFKDIDKTQFDKFLLANQSIYFNVRKILQSQRKRQEQKIDKLCSLQLTLIFLAQARGIAENRGKNEQAQLREIEKEIVNLENKPEQLEIILDQIEKLFGFTYNAT